MGVCLELQEAQHRPAAQNVPIRILRSCSARLREAPRGPAEQLAQIHLTTTELAQNHQNVFGRHVEYDMPIASLQVQTRSEAPNVYPRG